MSTPRSLPAGPPTCSVIPTHRPGPTHSSPTPRPHPASSLPASWASEWRRPPGPAPQTPPPPQPACPPAACRSRRPADTRAAQQESHCSNAAARHSPRAPLRRKLPHKPVPGYASASACLNTLATSRQPPPPPANCRPPAATTATLQAHPHLHEVPAVSRHLVPHGLGQLPAGGAPPALAVVLAAAGRAGREGGAGCAKVEACQPAQLVGVQESTRPAGLAAAPNLVLTQASTAQQQAQAGSPLLRHLFLPTADPHPPSPPPTGRPQCRPAHPGTRGAAPAAGGTGWQGVYARAGEVGAGVGWREHRHTGAWVVAPVGGASPRPAQAAFFWRSTPPGNSTRQAPAPAPSAWPAASCSARRTLTCCCTSCRCCSPPPSWMLSSSTRTASGSAATVPASSACSACSSSTTAAAGAEWQGQIGAQAGREPRTCAECTTAAAASAGQRAASGRIGQPPAADPGSPAQATRQPPRLWQLPLPQPDARIIRGAVELVHLRAAGGSAGVTAQFEVCGERSGHRRRSGRPWGAAQAARGPAGCTIRHTTAGSSFQPRPHLAAYQAVNHVAVLGQGLGAAGGGKEKGGKRWFCKGEGGRQAVGGSR